MKRLALALLAMIAFQPALAKAADTAEAETKYQTMLTAAKADPDSTDWQALRFAYADRPSFSMHASDTGLKSLQIARANHDWQGMLTAANSVLDVDYVDGTAHLAAAIALSQLGKSADADREQKIGVSIFKSMMPNGDGNSPDHAFVVISVAEEYELMAARQRSISRQSLNKEGNHSYDVVDAVGRNGDTVTFYFQVDKVMAAEAKMFGH